VNILFVSSNLPYPPNHGGNIRIFNLIKFLSRTHRITLLSTVWKNTGETEHINALSGYCETIPVIMDTGGMRKWALKLRHALNIFSKVPWEMEFMRSEVMREKLRELCASGKYDIVQFAYGRTAQYCDVIGTVPGIMDPSDIDWRLWRRRSENSASFLKKRYYLLEAKKIFLREKQILEKLKLCLVVSEEGRRTIEASGINVPTAIVPNGVDTGYFTPVSGPVAGMPGLLFMGSMDWFPNLDAMSYFCEDILPLVKRKYPGISVTVLGRDLDGLLGKLERKYGITAAGFKLDVRPYMKNTVLVAPIRVGEGTRFKILEAMAAGVPVVSTSVGCEGIAVKDRENILVADDAAIFSERIAELAEDGSLREKLGREGRKLVEARYSWGKIASDLSDVYRKVLL
jgi:polysaccharide biosynthesis protein PslH